MNYTPFARIIFNHRARRIKDWGTLKGDIQLRQLRWLLFRGATTEYGRDLDFEALLQHTDPREEYRKRIPLIEYEDIRNTVMRMINGEEDLLWPGKCRRFAQSSGTSGGVSKYIPITLDSLRVNHYAGSKDVVAQYLRNFPESRLFAGKAFILGGSFDNTLHLTDRYVKIGDLSATLIDLIPGPAARFRVPDKKIALLSDWNEKLDKLAASSIHENITNLSGVPSWFMRVILRALELSGKDKATDLWPNLEVFFHGGISFEPYRKEYEHICDPAKMHYFETYNASEGFFATQSERDNDGLLLLIDNGIYFEFLPLGGSDTDTVGIEDVEKGKIYELIITAPNGLWRYRIGDTVQIVDTDPVKIRIAGRTKSFINAFGEELMENNAEKGIAIAAASTGAKIHNYTAGPLYAHGEQKGRHQWAIEWDTPPSDIDKFAKSLDAALRSINSDYDAKRNGDIFLDMPEIISLPAGTFDRWLAGVGNRKLGGQRKIPRLRNDRSILDSLI
ncbi:MAG: GH3 auxin-responsive promoter family protein [Muribaculaceae bacterium]|nr:GH3 auxin-responsive promoter family protein [Muribaculaceae bacterium]